nr:DUF4296 domain-containing protein [uncultured Capnocytophaga sp.]
MKKITYIIILLLIFTACRQNIVPKPKNFLDEQQMENLLYDMAILETMKNSHAHLLDSLQFNAQEFIYQKYHTDSISLSQNMIYYASYPKEYDDIVQKVEKRLNAQRDSMSKASALPSQSLGQELESIK